MKIRLKEGFYLYELAKITGLFIWFLISALSWALTPGRIVQLNSVITVSLVEACLGYLLISLLYFILFLIIKKDAGGKKLFIPILVFLLLLIAVIWVALASIFDSLIEGRAVSFPHFFLNALFFLYPVIAFTIVFYLIKHKINLKKQKEMTLIATNLANEARLQMLRYQINPHFLFNSLNTIRSMVEEDRPVARKMITELASFFRYSLSHDGATDTLENEIGAIKNYLEIQKIRFEQRLIVEYDIDDRLKNLKIPIFIILPLVENAVKFGFQTSKSPLNVKIYAKINGNLEISVFNSGRIVENSEKTDGTNTGIENTRKRLALYFPDNYTFKLYQDELWVVSKITITDFRNHLPD
jgi:two-component system, LytTR family, sensor kinase